MKRFLKIVLRTLLVLLVLIVCLVAHANYRIATDETLAIDAQAPGQYVTVLEDLYAEIPRLATPSLVLWGENDWIVPRSAAERLARDTHAELVVLPGCWHMPFMDKPDEVAKRVLDFLRTP